LQRLRLQMIFIFGPFFALILISFMCELKRRIVGDDMQSDTDCQLLTKIRKEVKMKNESGFTLVELIIVIGVILLISTIAVPNIIVWRQNTQLSGAVRDIYSHFQKAKVEAIKRGTYCAAAFSSSGYVIFVDSDKDLVPDPGEEVIASISLSDYGNVSFDTSKGGGDGLTFSNPTNGIAFAADGLAKSAVGFGLGSVYLKNGNSKTAGLLVSSAGSIRLL